MGPAKIGGESPISIASVDYLRRHAQLQSIIHVQFGSAQPRTSRRWPSVSRTRFLEVAYKLSVISISGDTAYKSDDTGDDTRHMTAIQPTILGVLPFLIVQRDATYKQPRIRASHHGQSVNPLLCPWEPTKQRSLYITASEVKRLNLVHTHSKTSARFRVR